MTSCIVGKKIRAMGPRPLELFPFVVLAILMAMVGGISKHMLTSWSSFNSPVQSTRRAIIVVTPFVFPCTLILHLGLCYTALKFYMQVFQMLPSQYILHNT